MQHVNLEFKVKLNKEIYENSGDDSNTVESFFNQFVLKHLVSDLHMIRNLMHKNNAQEKYEPYVNTLTSFKESLPKTIIYKPVDSIDNIQEVDISCSFDYQDNSITTLPKMALLELFDRNINSNNFLSEDIKRFITPENKEKVENLSNIYKHVSDFLTEAKHTLCVNGEMV